METDIKLSFEIVAGEAKIGVLTKMAELTNILWEEEFTQSSVSETLVLAASNKDKALKETLPFISSNRKKQVRKLIIQIHNKATRFWKYTIGG